MINYFDLCNKYNISFNELMFIKIILVSQNRDDNELSNAYFKLSVNIRGSIKDILEHLQQVKIVSNTFKIPNPGEKLDIDLIPINKNFIKNFHKSSFYLGKELFEEFPLEALINGTSYKLRRVSKHFDSLEDFYRYYGKAISWNPEKHSDIIKLVKWGKENNLIQETLANFVIDRGWESLKQLKNKSEISTINIRTDSGESAKEYIKKLLTL